MSWRTQGQYLGLEGTDAAWLREFDRKWERKAHGRSRTDAMDHIVISDGVEKKGAPQEACDTFSLETLLITAGAQVRKITGPRPTPYGWEIRVLLGCGKRTWARFAEEAAAVQAYLAVCEFMHWFQTPTELSPDKRQEGGSPRRENGSPLTNRPAQDAPRERGPAHLAACPPQNPPIDHTQPPSPLTRSRPA